MQIRTLISESRHSVIWQIGTDFEVWIKLTKSVGKDQGKMIEPKDEDFGVWAWTAYSLEKALRISEEIEQGKRVVTPMVEAEL